MRIINISQGHKKCKIVVKHIYKCIEYVITDEKETLVLMKGILYLLLILTVPLTLYILSLETVSPTPYDDNHINAKTVQDCFECHGDDKEYARSEDHPPKDKCFKCHGPVKPDEHE